MIGNHPTYHRKGKYTHNDAGIPLDHEFPLQNGNWYDVEAVSNFVKTLN